MSLLERISAGMPRAGEHVVIYRFGQKLAHGFVITMDSVTVTIAEPQGLIDLDTLELRRGLNDGTISIRRD